MPLKGSEEKIRNHNNGCHGWELSHHFQFFIACCFSHKIIFTVLTIPKQTTKEQKSNKASNALGYIRLRKKWRENVFLQSGL